MSTKNITETAAGGSTGTGDIANGNSNLIFAKKNKKRLKDFLINKYNSYGNKLDMKYVVPFPMTIKEGFDLNDVLSRLRGLETTGKSYSSPNDNITYGVEDDDGNLMKITVPKNQSAEFESVLAHELAEIENFSVTGKEGNKVSMAELLFNLKNKFDIIDVDFPVIPTDVVYNADKASYNTPDDNSNDDIPDNNISNNYSMDLNNISGDGIDVTDEDNVETDNADNADMDEIDADNVEEFSDETENSDESSILSRVLDMLKSQAEAETAKANAEAEKYRADQAEYSARAAQATIAQQEELAKMDAEMERQKEQEKQAKKLADIAKYRVQKATTITNEADTGETVDMVRKLMSLLPTKWQALPTDDPATRAYKAKQQSNEMRELQDRMRIARDRDIRQKELANTAKQQSNQRNNNNQQSNQQNNQQQTNQNNNNQQSNQQQM
jgi:hypothetical protein